MVNMWLEPWNFMTFPSYWECHDPNWLYDIFQRGRLNHQPDHTTRSHIITDHHTSSQHLPWFSKGEVHGDGTRELQDACRCGGAKPINIWDVLGFSWIIELDDGKIYRKALYLMVKTMVSCKLSLKPIQWLEESLRNLMFGNCFMFLLTCQNPEQFCSWHSFILRNFQEDQQKKLGRTSSIRFLSKKYGWVWGKQRNDYGCNFKFVAFLNARAC